MTLVNGNNFTISGQTGTCTAGGASNWCYDTDSKTDTAYPSFYYWDSSSSAWVHIYTSTTEFTGEYSPCVADSKSGSATTVTVSGGDVTYDYSRPDTSGTTLYGWEITSGVGSAPWTSMSFAINYDSGNITIYEDGSQVDNPGLTFGSSGKFKVSFGGASPSSGGVRLPPPPIVVRF
jgi:hypothetical protein